MEVKQLELLIRGPIEDNYDVSERYDGNYNLWQRVVEVNPDKEITVYWQVINVYDDKKIAFEQLQNHLQRK